jgi:fatty acid desaturase
MARDVTPFEAIPWWYPVKAVCHVAAFCLTLSWASVVGDALPWPAVSVLGIFGASQLLGVYTAIHSAAHATLAEGFWNDLLGRLASTLFGASLTAYRVTHMRHHNHLREDDDPQDIVPLLRRSRLLSAAALPIVAFCGAPLFVWLVTPAVALYHSRRRLWIFSEMLCSWAVLLSLALWMAQSSGAWAVFVCSYVLAGVWGSLLDICYHQGLVLSNSPQASRSLECDGFGFWVLNGENRHAEHHLFPNVPGPGLAALSRQRREDLVSLGVKYESGYTVAFFRGMLMLPLFLPPNPVMAKSGLAQRSLGRS